MCTKRVPNRCQDINVRGPCNPSLAEIGIGSLLYEGFIDQMSIVLDTDPLFIAFLDLLPCFLVSLLVKSREDAWGIRMCVRYGAG